MHWILYGIFAAILAYGGTWLLVRVMPLFGLLDHPDEDRKRHARPIPLGGGLAIVVALMCCIGLARLGGDFLFRIPQKAIFGLIAGMVVLIFGGLLDDKYRLAPYKQLVFPLLATGIVVLCGIGPTEVTNPFGGVIDLTTMTISLEPVGTIVVFADLLVVCWLMGMMYTTKLLDGVDGLVSGVVGIGALILVMFTSTTQWYQPDIRLLAMMLTGVCAGFFVLNRPPARIFLGEGGSLVLGFFLSTLAILSGAKLAVTSLIMCIPIIDLLRVMCLRYLRGQSITRGGRDHLHHVLIDRGLTSRQVTYGYMAVAASVGVIAIWSGTLVRLILFVSMILVLAVLSWRWSTASST